MAWRRRSRPPVETVTSYRLSGVTTRPPSVPVHVSASFAMAPLHQHVLHALGELVRLEIGGQCREPSADRTPGCPPTRHAQRAAILQAEHRGREAGHRSDRERQIDRRRARSHSGESCARTRALPRGCGLPWPNGTRSPSVHVIVNGWRMISLDVRLGHVERHEAARRPSRAGAIAASSGGLFIAADTCASDWPSSDGFGR